MFIRDIFSQGGRKLNSHNAIRVKDVLLGILVIIVILIILPLLFTVIMTVLTFLYSSLSWGYVMFTEMMTHWGTNLWTSLFYFGSLVAEVGFLIIIIPLIIWGIRWLIKAGKWVYHVLRQRLGRGKTTDEKGN